MSTNTYRVMCLAKDNSLYYANADGTVTKVFLDEIGEDLCKIKKATNGTEYLDIEGEPYLVLLEGFIGTLWHTYKSVFLNSPYSTDVDSTSSCYKNAVCAINTMLESHALDPSNRYWDILAYNENRYMFEKNSDFSNLIVVNDKLTVDRSSHFLSSSNWEDGHIIAIVSSRDSATYELKMFSHIRISLIKLTKNGENKPREINTIFSQAFIAKEHLPKEVIEVKASLYHRINHRLGNNLALNILVSTFVVSAFFTLILVGRWYYLNGR